MEPFASVEEKAKINFININQIVLIRFITLEGERRNILEILNSDWLLIKIHLHSEDKHQSQPQESQRFKVLQAAATTTTPPSKIKRKAPEGARKLRSDKNSVARWQQDEIVLTTLTRHASYKSPQQKQRGHGMEFTKSLFYVSAVHFLLAYSRLVVDLKRAVVLSSLVVKSSETYYRKAFLSR